MDILTSAEVREVDQQLLKKESLIDIIQDVGQALSHWFFKNISKDKKILFLIGPGNNGNDALALGQILLKKSYKVQFLMIETSNNSTERNDLLKSLENSSIVHFEDLQDYDVIVDGLFGIGLDRDLNAEIGQWIHSFNNKELVRVAIDVPTGVSSDSGDIYDPCFKAHHTLAIAARKPCHLLAPAMEMCGLVKVVEVPKINKELKRVKAEFQVLPAAQKMIAALPEGRYDHKYSRGKVSVVMCEEYPGAGILCALSAHNSGAGYVEVYCPESMLQLSQLQYPALVFKPYKDKKSLLSLLSEDNSEALILGPGWDLGFVDLSTVVAKEKKLVFDGGLLLPELMGLLKKNIWSEVVLTPHLGELNRLCSNDKMNKVLKAKELAESTGCTLIVKGYDTLVINKMGPIYITDWNSPALAVAGSGDILSGLVGSFLAQGLDVKEAAVVAVDLHRLVAQGRWRITPEMMLKKIPKVIEKLRLN